MSRKTKKVVEFRVYDLPIHFPVLLLDGEEWLISDRMSNRLHFHNCLEIGICHAETGVLAFEEETMSYREGDVSCIPRHVLHTTCSTKGEKSRWSYLFVDLEKLLYDLLPERVAMPSISHCLLGRDRHPRMHFLVSAIMEEMKGCRENYEAIIKSLFHVLYFELLRLEETGLRSSDEQRGSSFALKPALEYIHDHYGQPIAIEMLAEMCHLSETHFRRRFVSIMGTSPLNFINATRVNQACVLLLTTEQSILSVAEEVGFTSISSFNRCFQQIMGVSPKTYRKPSVHEQIEPQRKYVLKYKGWMIPDAQPEHIRDE